MKTGDRVRARPLGADEVIPEANALDWEPYDGPTEDLVGTLEVRQVGGGDSVVPARTQYLVDGRLADPATIKPVATEAMRARAAVLAVEVHTFMADKPGQKHDNRTGRYLPKTGVSKPAETPKVAKKAAPVVPKKNTVVPKKVTTPLTEPDKRARQLEQLAEARRIAAEKRAAAKLNPPEPKKVEPKKPADVQSRVQEKLAQAPPRSEWVPDATRPAGAPPSATAVKLEASVRAAGAEVHNEVMARLAARGITPPKAATQHDVDKAHAAKTKAMHEMDRTEKDLRDSIAREMGAQNYLDAITGPNRSAIYARVALHPEYIAARKKYAALADDHLNLMASVHRGPTEFHREYRDEALKVLREVHGGEYGGSFHVDVASIRHPDVSQASRALRNAGAVYPSSWVEHSNSNGKLILEAVGGRGLHRWLAGPNQSNITVGLHSRNLLNLDGYTTNAIHEVGHRMEWQQPHVRMVEHAFQYRRTTNSRGVQEPSKSMRNLGGYRADEYYRKDKFADPYIGKVYRDLPTSPWEVFTVGMQSIFGDSMGNLVVQDLDHTHLILGLLAAG